MSTREPLTVTDPQPFRLGVVVFPGSNCDTDAGNAWTEGGFGEPVYLWHQDTDLKHVDAVVLPGGFSYGDALRAGAIARFAPMMESVARFAAEGGLVAAICNGFQIACEAGLLPGALARNEALRFVCRPVHLRVDNSRTPFTSLYGEGEVITIPVAHGEGRYVCDEATYAQLVAEERIVFRYCDAKGALTPDANPNGSQDFIAGIVGGPNRNILGMMPHPERACSRFNNGLMGSADGLRFFAAMHRALSQR